MDSSGIVDSSGNINSNTITAQNITTFSIDSNQMTISNSPFVDSNKNVSAGYVDSNQISINNSKFVDSNKNITARSVISSNINTATILINGKTLADGNKNINANTIDANNINVNNIQIVPFFNDIVKIFLNNNMKNFATVNLAEFNFVANDFTDANLTDTNLTNTNLTNAILAGANMIRTNLTYANLIGANLTDANLTDANLIGTNLTSTKLTNTNLTNTNLTNVNLTNADLTNADLTDADLTNVTYNNTLLNNTFILGTSLITNELLTIVQGWGQFGTKLTGDNYYVNFGHSVSLSSDGNTLATSATGNYLQKGYVKIFKKNDNMWNQLGTTLFGENNGDESVYSISLSGDGNTVAIGTDYEGNIGSVKIFRYISGTWNQLGITLFGENNDRQFGHSVSLSSDGNTVAIGTIFTDNSKGSVKIFKYSLDAWNQLGTTLLGENNYENFGKSVSISNDGTIVACGATGYDYNKGFVRIFKYSSDTWSQLGNSIMGENEYEYFGRSVSLNNDGTIVACSTTNYSNYKGSVKIFKYILNTWSQLGDSIVGQNEYEYSGTSVSLNGIGDIVAIGATNGSNTKGSVNIFKYNLNIWTKISSTLSGENGEESGGESGGDRFGYSVSLSDDGNTIVASAPNNNNQTGYVKTFRMVPIASGTL